MAGAPVPEVPMPPPPYYGPPVKKRIPAPVIAWIVAGLVMLATMGLYFAFLHEGNPRDALRRAVDKTLTGIAREQAETAASFGIGDALAALSEGPAQLDLWAEIPAPGSTARMRVDASMVADVPGKRAEGSVEIGTAGSTLLGMDFYLDGDLFAFGAPGVLSETYGFHTGNLGEDLARSPLGRNLPDGLDFSFDPFADIQAEGGVDTLAELNRLSRTLLDACEVTRSSGRETLEINGYELDCRPYEAVVPEEALAAYMEGAADLFAGALPGGYGAQLEPAMDGLPDATGGGATCKCYVWDGYLVKAVFLLEGRSVTLDVGGYFISDAFTLSVVEAGREVLRFATKGEKAPKYGYYSSSSALSVAEQPTGALADVLYFDVYYDPREALDNFGLVVEIPEQDYYFDAFGTLSVDKDARTLKADLYDAWLEAPGMSDAFSMGFSTAPHTGGYTFTDVDPVMLFELSETELAALLIELLQGVAGLPGLPALPGTPGMGL